MHPQCGCYFAPETVKSRPGAEGHKGGSVKKSVIEEIRKHPNKDKWAVYSKDGSKRLSRWYDSHGEAKKRLGQIEMFKAMAKREK